MRAFIRNIILTVFLLGCGGTASDYANALAIVARTVADIVKDNTGKSPEDMKSACETEWSADRKKFLLLCEFDVDTDKR